MQGIENLGSTCAINSLIQVISRNNILRNIILSNEFADNTISSQLKEIIDLMVVKNNSIIPHKFLNTLYSIFKDIFYKGEQIDVGELWTYLSDKIAEDIAPLPLPNKNNDNQNLHRSINYNHYFVVKSSENYKNMYTIHNKKHYSKYSEPLYK
jgi:ubiquitin C-terminal hydrolase